VLPVLNILSFYALEQGEEKYVEPMHAYIYVSGFEKRAHFAQNAKI